MGHLIQFPLHRSAIQRTIEEGNTRFSGWVFEKIASEEGTVSVAICDPRGAGYALVPGEDHWALFGDEMVLLGKVRGPREALELLA